MDSSLSYRSNGKLLLTGEYLVLRGAKSLAIPLKMGQSLEVRASDGHEFKWTSSVMNNPFVELNSNNGNSDNLQSSDTERSAFLIKTLKAAQELSATFSLSGKTISANIDFDLKWGFGSSSSLISNIAYMAEIDPFELHFKVSSGSGYDIACARSDKPIIYRIQDQKPAFEKVDFRPPFNEHIYFVYLGNKQDSAREVKNFKQKKISTQEIDTMNELTMEVVSCDSLADFNYLMREHELFMSSLLKIKTLKEDRFSFLDGEVKSLGAWGGDFCMITFEHGHDALMKELDRRGLNTCFSYNELSLF